MISLPLPPSPTISPRESPSGRGGVCAPGVQSDVGRAPRELAGSLPIENLVAHAFGWLCFTRRRAHSNHDVWHVRSEWARISPRLTARLSAGAYRLSTVRAIATDESGLLECLESQDAVVHKAAALALEGQLLPRLSRRCFHLRGRGGIKRAVQRARHLVAGGRYLFVARSDARGYYAHIRHTDLLVALRKYTSDPVLLDLVSQYCERTTVRDGHHKTHTLGIPLGSPLSPLMGALYLAPLDAAMEALSGVAYLRFMDDWIILAESRWKLRRAVRIMNQVLQSLGLEQHPEKTFIGRVERGFDFLGFDFSPAGLTGSSARSLARHTEKTVRLYEQGASPERIGRYRQNWRRWRRGILGSSCQPTPPLPAPVPPRRLDHQPRTVCPDHADASCPFSPAPVGAEKTKPHYHYHENQHDALHAALGSRSLLLHPSTRRPLALVPGISHSPRYSRFGRGVAHS
jgi:RNA-directed DNA polymerase